ncbi:hypothetical protein, partial [Micromonospora sp. 4G55]|uniref:hypothetical protein n=1 Tax=Micromonospora sp. 4G55 TaxID=2806102 RepID=UPI001A4DB160
MLAPRPTGSRAQREKEWKAGDLDVVSEVDGEQIAEVLAPRPTGSRAQREKEWKAGDLDVVSEVDASRSPRCSA